jgi:hypothetical protein
MEMDTNLAATPESWKNDDAFNSGWLLYLLSHNST